MDGWSSLARDSYVGITYTTIENTGIVNGALRCLPVPQTHQTTSNLLAFVFETLNFYNINPENILCFTTDNEAKMLATTTAFRTR